MRIPSGKTDVYLYFVAVDSTDLKTRETGLSSFTVYRSRNGAAEVAYTTPTITEIDTTNMPGVYALLIDEDTTITSGADSEEVCVHITQASMAPVTRTFELYRPIITSGQTITVANGAADADIERIQGTVVSTPATAGILDVNVKNIDNDAASASGTVTFPNATLASTTNITAGTITTATNVTTVNGLAANVITAAATAADFGTEVASAVWDTDATGHQTQGTFGQAIGDPVADTNTIYKAVVSDATGATVGVDVVAIKAETVNILADTAEIGTAGAGLTNINLPDQTMNITGNITGNLSGSVGSVTGAVGSVTGAVGSVTGNVGGNVTGSVGSIATGGIAAASFAAGAIDAAAIAPDAIGSSELAASAITEIQAGLSTLTEAGVRAAVGLASANLDTQLSTIDTVVDSILVDTAEIGAAGAGLTALVDLVWDEATAGHTTAGTTGKALTDAGSAGDPWSTALPGAYGAGTAGKIVGDNLNATVSSRASQTSVDDLPTNAELATALGTADDAVLAAIDDLPTNAELATALAAADDAVLAAVATVDTVVDAIKAKTDSLTFTVAGQVDANVQYVNDVQVTGDGQSGSEWGPV